MHHMDPDLCPPDGTACFGQTGKTQTQRNLCLSLVINPTDLVRIVVVRDCLKKSMSFQAVVERTRVQCKYIGNLE